MADSHLYLNELIAMVAQLRKDCPWTQQQSWSSLTHHTIEEAYEIADAVDKGESEHLKDELSDMLYHIIFYAQIAAEQGLFSLEDIAQNSVAKHTRRNKLLYTKNAAGSLEEVQQNWEQHKLQERAARADVHSLLDDIPIQQPALVRAVKLQKRAAQAGFDWPTRSDVITKLEEEVQELKVALQTTRNEQEVLEESGDILFCLVNLLRHLNVDPELALRKTNHKFTRRFQFIEQRLGEQDKPLIETSLAEMDELWDMAKREGL